MPDPVFDASDRVDVTKMTPTQVAAHYQERERNLRAAAETAIANASAGPGAARADHTPTPLTREQFDANPQAVVADMIRTDAVSRQEWNQMTGAVQDNLISSAKFQAMQGKQYWARLESVIDQMVKGADPLALLKKDFWETAYNAALGANLGTIRQEEEAARVAAASASAEAPSGGSLPPAAPRTLNANEMRVVSGLGITPDKYRKAEEMIRDNKFPLTYDNVSGSRRSA